MKRLIGVSAILTVLLFWGSVVLAQPGKDFRLPSSAVKISDGLYYLGRSVSGAQGYAILRYATGFAKPGGSGAARAPKCYGFLSKGARWKNTEHYVTDINDPATENSLETWDSRVSFDVFGSRDPSGLVDGTDTAAPDDKNELYFGQIEESGVIGVTTVWGYFYGPTFARELIEWDMVLDNTDFDWSFTATPDPTKMDYQNILTHELGHAAGLNDQYDTTCSEATMYGYGTEGETKKRDLAAPDITGIKELYR